MCGRLDSYLHAFANLRVDKNNNLLRSLTQNCSPDQPFLLLSVIDHISSDRITSSFIAPSFELTQTFLEYTSLMPQLSGKASMAYPFYHLESSGFWSMATRPPHEHRKGLSMRSMSRLQELYLGARLSEDLFPLLKMTASREKLRQTLISTYFSKQIQPVIINQSLVNSGSDRYASSLMGATEVDPQLEIALAGEPMTRDRMRASGFRKAIVQLYDHCCALCGLRMKTPEGYTAVDAAHIIPWSESQNDHPSNGMALCKPCHRSFDEGLMSVDREYRVMVSPAVMRNNNLPGHLMTLRDKKMIRPSQSRYWPDQDGFTWHRKKRFRKTVS